MMIDEHRRPLHGRPRKLNVIHLVLSLNIGGLERVVYDLVRHADLTRFNVHVVCLGEKGVWAPEVESFGVPVTALHVVGKPVAVRIRDTWSQLKELKPDVVHTHNIGPHLLGAVTSRLAGRSVVIHTKHGRNHPDQWKLVLRNRIASAMTDRIVAVSKDAAEVALEVEKIPPSKVEVVWNGIDLNRFCYFEKETGSDALEAIHVARLDYPSKDQRTLLRAVRLVVDEEPGFVLHLVGDGPDAEHLKELCSRLDLDRNVVFHGFRNDVASLLRKSRLFVLSSETEGLSLVLLEAMACGLPVVATDVGGNREVVKNGSTGLLVPPRSPAILADAMLRLLRNRHEAREMGAAGRLRVEKYFDIHHTVAKYESLYESLTGAKLSEQSASLSPNWANGNRSASPRGTKWFYRNVLIRGFESVIKRRPTFRYLRELERSQWLTVEEIEERQLGALRQLLEVAGEQCSYYRETWRNKGLDPRALRSLADLTAWPMIDRDIIRSHRAEMQNPKVTGLITKATGGSTGVPLVFDLDPRSNDRRMAAWHRGYGWASAGLGTRQWYLWGSAVGNVSRWKKLKDAAYHALYRRRIVSCFGMSDARIADYVNDFNRTRPDCIVAYTNPLYEFARTIEERGLCHWKPRSIVVGAEKLHSFQRELIERVFEAPVFETYGSREFTLIGGECAEHAGLHLTMENLLVEIVDDDGLATPAGEEGNVVITDLTNYGMPFIRYQNGDRAIAGLDRCRCGRGLPLLKQVTGRQLDILETVDGRHIPGEFFPHLIKEYRGVRRFQVVQENLRSVKVLIVPGAEWTLEDHRTLETQVRRVIGPETELEIACVEDIPLTRSGKQQVVVRRDVCSPSVSRPIAISSKPCAAVEPVSAECQGTVT